jgi:hypothetical protein
MLMESMLFSTLSTPSQTCLIFYNYCIFRVYIFYLISVLQILERRFTHSQQNFLIELSEYQRAVEQEVESSPELGTNEGHYLLLVTEWTVWSEFWKPN